MAPTSCCPGIVFKNAQYRVLIILTTKDSKTFFLCSSESKMESKGTFESRINLITLDHTFLTPDLK